MKFTLLNLLTVSLVTFAVISPDLLVLAVVWDKHMDLVENQYLVSPGKTVSGEHQSVSYINTATESSQPANQINYSYADLTEPLMTFEAEAILLKITLGVLFFLPLFIWSLILIHQKYMVYRASIYQKKVEFLERMWQQSM